MPCFPQTAVGEPGRGPACWAADLWPDGNQIPVLFGGGRRLFDGLPSRLELEIVRVVDTPEATHIRYSIRR
jgi:hypothetical protein